MPESGLEAGVQTFGGAGDERAWSSALWRGMKKRCPQCGRGAIFSGYSRTADICPACGLDISGHRADDAPPYVTILLIGHILIPLMLAAKQVFDPPLALQFFLWLPLVAILTLVLLPISKGALIGLQWANRMHGFAGDDADPGADV